jgi:ABC-type multidrug transport system ATPase subunit
VSIATREIYLTASHVLSSATFLNDQVIVIDNGTGAAFYYTVEDYGYNNQIITTVEALDPSISASTHKFMLHQK